MVSLINEETKNGIFINGNGAEREHRERKVQTILMSCSSILHPFPQKLPQIYSHGK